MMKNQSEKIIIVAYQYSIVVKGIEKNLRDEGYEVLTVQENSDLMREYAKQAAVFIVYLPENILSDVGGLKGLEDINSILEEYKRGMIIIGEKKNYGDFMKSVPVLNKHTWLNRPVDKDVLVRKVEQVISSGGEGMAERRLLIIDDDPSYARMIREWLKDIYRVNVVTTGKLAMNFLGKNAVDLILLDYEMPEMDGPQVLEMIHKNPDIAKIPVVFLTGVNTADRIKQVMSLKPAGYVLKSTTREDLIEKIKELI